MIKKNNISSYSSKKLSLSSKVFPISVNSMKMREKLKFSKEKAVPRPQ
jgi:hypothetical protein